MRYDFRRIHSLPRREGFKDNHKRVHRIYKEKGLNLRSKRPMRARSAAHRLELPASNELNHCSSMDFVQDARFNGQKFRYLTIVDNFSRYCHAIRVGKSIRGIDVMEVIEALKRSARHCLKDYKLIMEGNLSKEFDRSAYDNNFFLDFSRPGKPTHNPLIESFRDERLNVN